MNQKILKTWNEIVWYALAFLFTIGKNADPNSFLDLESYLSFPEFDLYTVWFPCTSPPNPPPPEKAIFNLLSAYS